MDLNVHYIDHSSKKPEVVTTTFWDYRDKFKNNKRHKFFSNEADAKEALADWVEKRTKARITIKAS